MAFALSILSSCCWPSTSTGSQRLYSSMSVHSRDSCEGPVCQAPILSVSGRRSSPSLTPQDCRDSGSTNSMSQSAASGSVSIQDERGHGIAAASEGGVLAISSQPVAPLTLLLTLEPNGGEKKTKASGLLNGFLWPFYTGWLPKEMRAKKLDWRRKKWL